MVLEQRCAPPFSHPCRKTQAGSSCSGDRNGPPAFQPLRVFLYPLAEEALLSRNALSCKAPAGSFLDPPSGMAPKGRRFMSTREPELKGHTHGPRSRSSRALLCGPPGRSSLWCSESDSNGLSPELWGSCRGSRGKRSLLPPGRCAGSGVDPAFCPRSGSSSKA